MLDLNPWPKPKKLWAGDNSIMGLIPRNNSVVVHNQTGEDIFVLLQTGFKGFSSTGSDTLRPFERKPGHFTYLPKGVDQHLEAEETGDILFFSLPSSIRKQCADHLGHPNALEEPFYVDSGLPQQTNLNSLMNDFLFSDGLGGNLRADALATLLVSEVVQFQCKGLPDPSKHYLAPRTVKLIEEYLDANNDDKVSIEDLAGIAGVSKFHFARMFKKQTGISPHQFVLRHRVQRLQELLYDTEMNLAELAYATGFSSQSHMTQTFMKFIGVTPSKYRHVIRK